MRHFSDEDWLDFVRDVMPTPQRGSVQEHLRSGCPQCARLLRFWENVRDTVPREGAIEVPAETVQAGEAMFADWRRRFVLPVQAKRARPIFDSLLEPLPAGIRAAALPPRRVLHRWGPWTVDLRIDSEPGERMSVTGQMLRTGWRPEEGSRIPVFLMGRDALVGQSDANQFGEFQFTFQRASDLTIYIDLPGRPAIAVPLPDPDRPLPVRKKASGVKSSENRPGSAREGGER